ncbi:ZPR1-related zinc finger protein [Methanococcus maripaludis KA1]|jgi:zinc finger protein|uniref:Zinc finger protein n=2 Tax=Methanococcus maripaludis TaxID=39152 RepID=A0A7J9S0X2_METMI|nr:ZPR1 zinc finger domain-containing protein [Methanococcus maripaludis]MBB6067197.1 zinc finger protein [Methanococcus maripaludis]BAP61787.1 ZPR1-related zinc finger protein [Methanococcus maripaludis KA1]
MEKQCNVMDCPICGKEDSLKLITQELEIPYFGKVIETTILCEACKYKKSDIFPVDVKEPKRYTLTVEDEYDLNKRVIRGSSGHISIPEFGFEVSPGPASEAYVSNVEGVLTRMEDAIKTLKSWVENEDERKKADELIEKLEEVKLGKEKITLILEDPLGHSAIIGDGVKEELLTQDEIALLSDNTIIMDK